MERVDKGEKYWCVGEDMNPLEAVCGENWALDVLRLKAGNCYTDYHECYVICGKLRAVLAGADVIQIPSGAEILDAAEEHVEACDEDGCPYADVEDAKAAFGNGVYWLMSKIIK